MYTSVAQVMNFKFFVSPITCWLNVVWYCKEKFCLGHLWKFKGYRLVTKRLKQKVKVTFSFADADLYC